MRKGKVLSLKNLRLGEFFSKNNSLLIPVVFVCSGIAAGIFLESRVRLLSDYAGSYIERFINLRTNASYFSSALDSFMGAELFLLCVFAAGTSMLGVVLVPLAAAFRGVLYGGVSAFLYSQYAVKGIAFNAVLIIPSAFVFVVALLLASRESVRFSLLIARMTIPSAPAVNLSYDFKNYCGRYLFISLIALASALADAALSCAFIGGLSL